jgi:predicted RNA-binding protein YlxR (DUF448 family)
LRKKRVPLRLCLGCRQVKPKKELVRVVRSPDGAVDLDPTGKKAGRGAYVCPSPECLESAVKGNGLARVLETSVSEEVLEKLRMRISGFEEVKSG